MDDICFGGQSIILNNRFMRFISGISMEIYLSHLIVLKGLHILKFDTWFGNGVLSYIISLVMLLFATVIFVIVIKLFLKYFGIFIQRLRKKEKMLN